MTIISRQNLANNIRGKMRGILNYKLTELEKKRKKISLSFLRQAAVKSNLINHDFAAALKVESGISLIAEIKRASPSVGEINPDTNVLERAKTYEKAGANAISVLTDEHFFKGSLEFLKTIRQQVDLPLLRKDFIFDEYQIYESKLNGADAVLLIASILHERQLKKLLELARTLGMSSIVEVHTIDDAKKAAFSGAEIIGVNNRNLSDFEINPDNFFALVPFLQKNKILIAESGIENGSQVARLREAGADCVLVGTALMRSDNLTEKIHELKLLI